ncbi:hypothetical protein D3C86_2176050 [compost metagenome]
MLVAFLVGIAVDGKGSFLLINVLLLFSAADIDITAGIDFQLTGAGHLAAHHVGILFADQLQVGI